MILVLFLLAIIILILGIITIITLSSIQLEVKDLELKSKNISEKICNKTYYIKISIVIFNKYKIFTKKLDDTKMKKIYKDVKYKKLDLNKIKEKIYNNYNKKEILDIIKKIKIRIMKLNLKVNLGIEDVILTSYINAIISSVIGIVLPKIIKKEDLKNCIYVVNPLYRNINEYYINLDSIINVKIVHIIYIIYTLLKKGRDKNERSSNRRTYAYSYERN